MRELTADEIGLVEKSCRRRSAAYHLEIRHSALAGKIRLMTDLLSQLEQATPAARARLEPSLLERKARLLREQSDLHILVSLFRDSSEQLLRPIVGSE